MPMPDPEEPCVLAYFDIAMIDEIYVANGFHLTDPVVEDMTYEEHILMEDATVGSSLDPETVDIIIPGLDEEIIDAHMERIVIESQDHLSHLQLNNNACSICRDEYLIGDVVGKVNCLHRFHMACIKPWLRASNTCPLCRETALNV